MNEKTYSEKLKTFDSSFWWIFIPFLIFIIAVLFLPYFFTQFQLTGFDFTTTGQIGDTLGGILDPFIAIAAAILTFLAFWVQFKANEQQKTDLKIERFENKFYQLIQIHRNNVSEIIIGKSTIGRKAFVSMFNELKFTYLVILNYYDKSYPFKNEIYTQEILYNISYLIFFFGIGSNSSPIVLDLIGAKYKGFFLCVEEHLKEHQNMWKDASEKKESIATNEKKNVYALDIKYKPFNGHMSRISHYIRHIFQIVKFVDEEYPDITNYEAKYNYIATLRAQLSTHEQLLIFNNALSVLGKPWITPTNGDTEHYLKKYCIIKSLPLPVANFYKVPSEVFGPEEKNLNGKILFEWYEIKTRLNTDKS